jgi:hypothetical protein
MKRAPIALAAATIALAAVSVIVPDGLRDSTELRASATPAPADIAAGTPSASTLVRSVWRLDLPKSGGPYMARVSPDAQLVAVETGSRSGGAVLYEIRPPVTPSDVAKLREIVRLDGAASPVLWLPDSSGLLAYEPDGPSSPSGTLSLVGASGRRWSMTGSAVSTLSGARFSPDGRQVALWANPTGVLVVALDGTASQKFVGDNDRSFLGWDAEGNVLFRVTTTNTLEARAGDQRVAYTVALPETLRYLNGGAAAVPQPSKLVLLWFESGCCAPRQHIPLILFDRALHEIPAEFEDVPTTIGDGPWRGSDLVVKRKADGALMAFDPRTSATRTLGVKLSGTETIWGISGDYLALSRRIIELSTGREIPLSATAPWAAIIALGSGRFVLWRDGTTQLLDATAWMATPQDLTDALVATPDQVGVQPGWVRVRDDDGGFTIALPTSWHAYDGAARGAVLASEVLVPANTPSAGEMRIEIRLDIEGPRGPGDFLDGLVHHGGGVIERRTVKLAGASAEFATVFDNTLYPRPATTLNWALRSPFFPERIVWIRAWPLESGRRAEVEAVVATLEFVLPR